MRVFIGAYDSSYEKGHVEGHYDVIIDTSFWWPKSWVRVCVGDGWQNKPPEYTDGALITWNHRVGSKK